MDESTTTQNCKFFQADRSGIAHLRRVHNRTMELINIMKGAGHNRAALEEFSVIIKQRAKIIEGLAAEGYEFKFFERVLHYRVTGQWVPIN